MKPEKGIPFGWIFPVYDIIGSTPATGVAVELDQAPSLLYREGA